MVILPFVIYFLKKEQREHVISRTASFCCQRYKTDFLSFMRFFIFYEIFEKLVSATMSLTAAPT